MSILSGSGPTFAELVSNLRLLTLTSEVLQERFQKATEMREHQDNEVFAAEALARLNAKSGGF